MKEKHQFFMQRAIALAHKGHRTEGGGAFGAVIVRNDQVLVEVFNHVKADQDCTQHAELRAIQKACALLESKGLQGCTLYTSCEPCMMCLGASYWSGLDAIYFGASAEDAKRFGYIYTNLFYKFDKEQRYKEFNMHQLLRDEAVAVWEDKK